MSDVGHFRGPPPKITTVAEAVALRSLLHSLERALEELPADSKLLPDLGADAIRISAALATWDAERREEGT